MAEDEILIRMEAADMLSDAGFDVLEASSAAGALRFLEANPRITLLFTDIEMPGGINGLELAREVEQRWPHVAVIVCSGRIKPSPEELPANARFIDKPYGSALFLRTMREIGLG